MQVGHVADADTQLNQIKLCRQVVEHPADNADLLALPPVNPTPSFSASSTDRLSLLSPLNAAPSVPSADAKRPMPSTTAASLPSPRAAPTAPAFALPGMSIAAEARSKQGVVPPRAQSNKLRVSAATQQGGSPTMHTFRLPDMTSNVTIATKDAFAAVNAMFSTSLSHEPCPTSKPAALVEPTVTISTRAAFAELNQMFSSDLPHRKQHVDTRQQNGLPRPAARRIMGRKLPLEKSLDQRVDDVKGTLTAAAVGPAPQCNFTSQQAEGTGTLGIYEDTCLLDNTKLEAGKVDPHSYAPYEDIKFFGKQAGAQHATSPTANQTAGGFQIYEDTQCIQDKSGLQPPTDSGQDAALGVYEDTQFVSRDARAAALHATSPAGFGIYEDTQFIHKADSTDANRQLTTDQSLGGFGVYEDTQLVHKPGKGVAAASPSPGGLGFYEDTQFVNSNDDKHPKLKTEVQSSVLAAKPEEVEDKENQSCPARYD